MSDACLVLENVSRSFGGLTAVDRVNLIVRAGERRAVIGPNGAGKTTLFNLISGETMVTAGTITLNGRELTRLPPHRRAALGVARTFQITRLFPNLSVRDNLLIACEALHPGKFTMHRPLSTCAAFVENADRLIDEFALGSLCDTPARNLAYGDQRKLEVALSMAGRPRLLLLDEPMAGLSAAERATIARLLDTIDPAMAVLLIEHDMDVAFAFANRVAVLHQGGVLADAATDEVAADPRVQEIYLGARH